MKKIYYRSIYTKNDAGNIFFMSLFLPSFFATLLLSLFFPALLLGSGAEMTQNETVQQILVILSAQGGMFLVYFLYNKILKMNPYKAGRISFKINWVNVFLSVSLGAFVLFGLNDFINLADILITKAGYVSPPWPLPLHNGWWYLLNIVLLAVSPAIVEELLFRGVIYNGLRQYGKKIAIVLSAILFALIHGNVEQTVYPILFGIILAYIVYKTDNIIYAMIAHFINNFIVITVNFVYTLNPHLQPPAPTLTPTFIILAVLGLIITFAVAYFVGTMFKKIPNSEKVIPLEDLPETIDEQTLEILNSDSPISNNPEGVDKTVWEKIICQKNDLIALEKAKTSGNVLLWIGVAMGIIFWIASI